MHFVSVDKLNDSLLSDELSKRGWFKKIIMLRPFSDVLELIAQYVLEYGQDELVGDLYELVFHEVPVFTASKVTN